MSQSSGTPPRAALLRATLRRAAASRLGSNFQLPSGVAGFNLAKHRANPTQEEGYNRLLFPFAREMAEGKHLHRPQHLLVVSFLNPDSKHVKDLTSHLD
uniref:Uncharacterized protein n=1 Tax=Oryza glumipatula TaxID=40148 RepID=A0A0E0AJW5_9ORYZ